MKCRNTVEHYITVYAILILIPLLYQTALCAHKCWCNQGGCLVLRQIFSLNHACDGVNNNCVWELGSANNNGNGFNLDCNDDEHNDDNSDADYIPSWWNIFGHWLCSSISNACAIIAVIAIIPDRNSTNSRPLESCSRTPRFVDLQAAFNSLLLPFTSQCKMLN